jgi:hypothetical protein
MKRKRLSKKEVQEILTKGATLHQDYTVQIKSTTVTGVEFNPKIYVLPDDTFLWVFDGEFYPKGKGEIFTRQEIEDYFILRERNKENRKIRKGNAGDNWHFYTKYGATLIENIDNLINDLADKLHIPKAQLDFSYNSLDIVSDKLKPLGIEETMKNYYDHVVAYIGEVIKRRVDGFWEVNTTHAGGDYLYIAVKEVVHLHYMPTNVFWSDMTPSTFINLRKTTADEVRRHPLLNFYRRTKSSC